MSPRDIASVMTEAIVEFASQCPIHLRQITVCIYQSKMVAEFADAVAIKAAAIGRTPQRLQGICGVLFNSMVVRYSMPASF